MITLIPGYAIDLNCLFRSAKGANAGFCSFDGLLDQKMASVFRWNQQYDFPFWQSLQPWEYYRVYTAEKHLATSSAMQQKLHQHLEKTQPTSIVCHSLGCELLFQYMKKRQLPPSVKEVIFLQADLAAEELEQFPRNTQLNSTVSLTNCHFFFDPSLVISWLLSGKKRAGLIEIHNPEVKNWKLISLIGPNTHANCLSDQRVIEKFFSQAK